MVADGRPADAVTAGEELADTGWALAGHWTPYQVAVTIDGRRTFTTHTFVDRPDVRQTLGETRRCGWRVPLETAALAPGEHDVTALAWVSLHGEGRYLGSRKLTVLAA